MKKLPKNYRNMSRKELKAQLLHQMQCNIQIVGDNRNIVQENMRLQKTQIDMFNRCAKTTLDEAMEAFEKKNGSFPDYISNLPESNNRTKQINETCTKTRNDTDIEFSCSINTDLPQKISTDSIQNAIDSFEKIRGESQ